MQKKITKILIILLMITAIIICTNKEFSYARTSNSNINHFDVVFVIDDSGSMKATDPNQLSAEALRQFLDILPESGDQVGVVTYGLDVLETISLREIRSQTDKEDIKNFSRTKLTQSSRWTDAASGLEKAADLLDEFKKNTNEQVIILITDGENDFGDTGRTSKESDDTLDKVIAKGYPVYSIGINPVSQKYKNYVEDIANRSGAKSYLIRSSKELPQIFFEIQSDLFGTDITNQTPLIGTDGFSNVEVEIPEGVFEANIHISHTNPIRIRTWDPSHNRIKKSSNKVIYAKDKRYTNIKLIEPEAGKWTIGVKGTVTEKVNVSIIYNYDISVDLEGINENTEGEKNTYIVKLSSKGTQFQNSESYKNLECILNIKGEKEDTIKMEYKDKAFVTEYSFDKKGNYTLTAIVKGSKFTKESKEYNLKINASSVVVLPKSKKFLVWWILVIIAIISCIIIIIRLKVVGKGKNIIVVGNFSCTRFAIEFSGETIFDELIEHEFDVKSFYEEGNNTKVVLNKFLMECTGFLKNFGYMGYTEVVEIMDNITSGISEFNTLAEKIEIQGTHKGKNGIVVMIPGEQTIRYNNYEFGQEVEEMVKEGELQFELKNEEDKQVIIVIQYKLQGN